MYIKNSSGKRSASLTMAIIGFALVSLWLLGSVIGAAVGVPFPAFEPTAAMAYLTPLLTLYFGRRWTSDSQGNWSGEGGEEKPSENDSQSQ